MKGYRASIATEFKSGQHWREKKPYWGKAWLEQEYIEKFRSAAEIAADWDITQNTILYWLDKHGIPRRSMEKIRSRKYWGSSGSDNPMYGRNGELNPNWKGGIAAERQTLYSSRKWANVVRKVWKRDSASCQRCRKSAQAKGSDSFHIHHVISFEVERFRTDYNNLVLLCRDCHHWVHSRENAEGDFINDDQAVSR